MTYLYIWGVHDASERSGVLWLQWEAYEHDSDHDAVKHALKQYSDPVTNSLAVFRRVEKRTWMYPLLFIMGKLGAANLSAHLQSLGVHTLRGAVDLAVKASRDGACGDIAWNAALDFSAPAWKGA